MKLRLVIRTCSNEHVARAALLSIGGDTASRAVAEAARYSLSVGVSVAQLVRDFERTADLPTWARAEVDARETDQPILAGLYFILTRALDRRGDAVKGGGLKGAGPLNSVA